jgi:hypothetical protein
MTHRICWVRLPAARAAPRSRINPTGGITMPLLPALARRSPLRFGLVLTAAAALAGCGGLPKQDDLAGPPGATHQSSKSPAAYAQCLTPRWQATRVAGGAATVETVPGAGGSLRMTG